MTSEIVAALPNWLDEFLEKPGASGVAALIAALVAFVGVMASLTAENRRRQAEYRIDAVGEAIKELNTSLHAIRQRHLAYRIGASTTDELRAKRRDKATARNATLPAAKARLQVVNLRTKSFAKAHDAINIFSKRSWKATDPDGPPDTSISDAEVWGLMGDARDAITAFSDDITSQIYRKRIWRRVWLGAILLILAGLVLLAFTGPLGGGA